MEFEQVVRRRRMTRNFTGEPVPPEVLDRILDLARRGPSAGYTQGQNFIVITAAEMHAAVAKLSGEQGYVSIGFDPFLSRAPVLIVACTSEAAYHRRYQEPDKVNKDGTETDWPGPAVTEPGGICPLTAIRAAVGGTVISNTTVTRTPSITRARAWPGSRDRL